MKSAQEKMAPLLHEISFQKPSIPGVSNVSAQAEVKNFADLLTRQIVSPVRWRESVLYMHNQGITTFVECGPGSVLSGLVRRILPDSIQIHVADTATLNAFLNTL